ncbi:cytochrome P450 [Nocardia donostiensis]|uniref:cytochrome P450 n=1 Tax=Nocardia donostiensis TaxID=1538463 RepID=UPI0009DACF3B|nr:cytochrome P450 [Nocardia donostiensis]OQS14067.1 cytochrome P450 [Nocardia donostiensis]
MGVVPRRSGEAAPRAPRPALAHAIAAGIDFERYFRWRRERDGDPFRLRFPGLGAVLFTGIQEGAREVFRSPVHIVEPPRPNPIEPLVGTASLILTNGDRHRQDRALLAPAFHPAQLQHYGTVIQEAALREMSGRWHPGVRIDARTAATAITLQVILTAVFGVAKGRHAAYTAAIADFLGSFTGPLMLAPALRHGVLGRAPWDRFVTARDRLDQLLLADIARRRRRGAVTPDILTLLLSCRYDDGTAITDADLCDQLRTLLVAGHDTTANTLAWAMWRVYGDPAVSAQLRAELRSAGPVAQTAPAGLPYLNAVCRETLRLHPAVPIVLRRVAAPTLLRDAPLAAGEVMGVALPLLHSDPAVWAEPELFRPARFLRHRYSPFEFAPFGGGHRRCLGAAFAEFELRVALATIAAGANLRPVPGRAPRSRPHGIATRPSRPLLFDVIS